MAEGKPSKVANEILSSVNDLAEAVDALAKQFDSILDWQVRLDNRLTNLHDKVDIMEARVREIHVETQDVSKTNDTLLDIKYSLEQAEKNLEKFSGTLGDVDEVLYEQRLRERKEWMKPAEFKLIRTR